jgi:hypothetical protein
MVEISRMPTSLQYPLERKRDVQDRWGRLLQRTAPRRCSGSDLLLGQARIGDITPPRDRNDNNELDDEEEENEEEEDREPAVIREPDKDE